MLACKCLIVTPSRELHSGTQTEQYDQRQVMKAGLFYDFITVSAAVWPDRKSSRWQSVTSAMIVVNFQVS